MRGLACTWATTWTWSSPIRPHRNAAAISGRSRSALAAWARRAASAGDTFNTWHRWAFTER